MGWRHVVAGCTIVTLPVIRNGHMSPRSSINQLQTISCDNKLWKSWISFNANHAMGQFEQFCWCHCHQQGSDFAHINCIHCFWWETIYSCLDVQLFANIVDILWHCTTGQENWMETQLEMALSRLQPDVMPRVPQCILMRLPPHMLHSNVLNRPRWLSSTRYGSEVTTQLIPRYQMDKNDPQTQPTVNLHSCSEDDFPPLFQIESVALYGMAG